MVWSLTAVLTRELRLDLSTWSEFQEVRDAEYVSNEESAAIKVARHATTARRETVHVLDMAQT
jgi:hypothetical protein